MTDVKPAQALSQTLGTLREPTRGTIISHNNHKVSEEFILRSIPFLDLSLFLPLLKSISQKIYVFDLLLKGYSKGTGWGTRLGIKKHKFTRLYFKIYDFEDLALSVSP